MIFADPVDEISEAERQAEAEIDAIAARDRDDDARTETGYTGAAPLVLTAPLCRVCNVGPREHWMPGDRWRDACAKCQGGANRDLVDELAAAMRTLKTSDDNEAMKAASDRLIAEFGRGEGRERVDFIARNRAEGKYKPKTQRAGAAA